MADITNGFFEALNDPKAAMWSAGVAFNRSNPLPLDKWSVFQSMTEAETYAGTNAVAYPGQLIAVVDNGKMVAMILAEDETAGKLIPQQIGIIPTGEGAVSVDENGKITIGTDGATIEVVNGKLTLLGFAGAEEGAQLVKQNGKIVWVKPDTTTVEGLSTTVEALDKVVNGTTAEDGTSNNDGLVHRVADLETDLENRYTKDETDEKINEEIGKKVHMTKKVVSSVDEMTEEDVMYLLPVEGATGEDIYKEYYLINEEPVCIGDTSTDLSGYAKSYDVTTEITEKIEEALENIEDGAQVNKIDNVSEEFEISADGNKTLSVKEIAQEKIAGLPDALIEIRKGLMTDEERQKLSDIEDNAEKNFIKSVNEDEFTVDESGNLVLKSIAQSKVSGLGDALANFVTKVDGKGLSTNDFTNELKEKLDNVKANAQENVIEIIKLGSVSAPVNNKTVEIPMATASALGLVKSSEEENKVKVLDDGTMEVNNLHVSKLVQDEDEVLVLYGGDSSSGSTEVVA